MPSTNSPYSSSDSEPEKKIKPKSELSPEYSKKRRKHRNDEEDEPSRHHRHRHKKSRRPSPAPDRPRDDHSSSRVRDPPATNHPIKGERHDPGYDRAARGPRPGPERAERGSGREQRPNREQRDSRAREDRRRVENRRRRAEDDHDPQEEHWGTSTGGAAGGAAGDESGEAPKEKESADFGLSGKLAEDTNTFRGVVVKYNEPTEARKPKRRWRLYPFKGDEGLPVLHIHRQSAYLLGRDRRVADIPVDHPSCSKQHAALQFRLVPYEREDGTRGRRIRPYVIDLGSANGTYINNKRIESERYVELMEKDVLKFGYSTREYVVLAENTKTESEHEGDSE